MDDNMDGPNSGRPAVLGKTETSPVSNESAPSADSDGLPQVSSDEIKVKASAEAAKGNVDESATTSKSMIEALKECIPEGCGSVLERMVYDRPAVARARLKLDSNSSMHYDLTSEVIWERIARAKPGEHGVLVIDNVDQHWCDALCARYPKAINQRFLLEHILGLDAQAKLPWHNHHNGARDVALELSVSKDLERLDLVFPYLSDPSQESSGHHIDCWVDEEFSMGSPSVRGCRLVPIPSGWEKANRFVSYCKLEDNFYLVLTTSPAVGRPRDPTPLRDGTLCMSLGWRAGIRRTNWGGINMFLLTTDTFGTFWPFFTSKVPANIHDHLSAQKLVDGFLLVAWMTATAKKPEFQLVEAKMRSIAYDTYENDQRRFTHLIAFRRKVGGCYKDLRTLRYIVKETLEGVIRRSPFHEGGSEGDTGLDWSWREDAERQFRDYLAELERRLDITKDILNEEIQVTVGTVQVRDAQIMKEQTRVTARQTTWTVALTVLAAVYLPMTLVTGIFGMNITEISSETTAPNAWWVLGAWAVIVVVTVAGIVLYVVISKLRNRKKRSDLEANRGNGKGRGRVMAKTGQWFGMVIKRWRRNLKEKAKMMWDRKRE